MSKKFIIVTTGTICVLLIFIIVLFLETDSKQDPLPILPTPTSAPIRTPEKINISGVEVDNFLIEGTVIDNKGDTVITEKPEFEIIYLAPFNQFIITVLATPFESVRQKAEAEFLQKIGTTKEDACKLDVTIGTTYDVDPINAGTNFPLSFCN